MVLTKWRGWARVNARQYLMDWDEIPRFGYPPGGDWPPRRTWGNRLSPLLVVPYGVLEFIVHVHRMRQMRPLRQVVRISAYWGLYAVLVQIYVVKYRYFE